jgi:type II secretory pathway predicted ATPase ExeA
MKLGAAGLKEQPFRVHGKPLIYVSYEARQSAIVFLRRVRKHRNGLGLFLGPPLSGKTTILHSFVESLEEDTEVAIVDATSMNAATLLENILGQYGFQLDLDSINEHLNMVKVFLLQRSASGNAPILIIENLHAMNPSAFRVVSELAELKYRGQAAARIVLSSDRNVDSIMQSPAMRKVAVRQTDEFLLKPLTEYEATDYLYEKLRAGGCSDPENVIPDSVCDEFHRASGGWPGVLDRLVLLALARATHCPLTKDHVERPILPSWSDKSDHAAHGVFAGVRSSEVPQVYVTKGGKTLRRVVFDGSRLMIGRTEHNDIRVDSRFVSRHHALLIRHGSTTLLMDLNSTNGTFVNSRRISNQVLMNDDIISIGNHRIKFAHADAKSDVQADVARFADTVIMKSLQDMRQMLASENTQAMPSLVSSRPDEDRSA